MIRIVSAKPLPGYRLHVAFNDGANGIFSVEPQRRGGVFLKLLEPCVFDAVTVNPDFGCVEWPGGIDLCPTAMHEEILGSLVRNKAGVAHQAWANTKEALLIAN